MALNYGEFFDSLMDEVFGKGFGATGEPGGPCEKCGETAKTYNGLCKSCIMEMADYDTFGRFLEYRSIIDDEPDDLEFFMFSFFGASVPDKSSKILKDMLIHEYKRQVLRDKLFGIGFLADAIKKYISETGAINRFSKFVQEGVKK